LSSLVQRSRPAAVRRPDPLHQHWGMVIFESLSAGVLTIFLVFALILIAIGVYGVVVWPLTFWDLANLGLEEYGSWVNTIVWSLFAGGSLAGYYVFGGAAFRAKQKARTPVPSRSARSSR
jgi:hypothetical protein